MTSPDTPFNIKNAKRASLSFLLLAIFVAANFEDSGGIITRYIYRPLSALGVDVAMTPLTADMMFMVDAKSKSALYLRQPQLLVEWLDQGQQELSFRSLDLYLFRLPLLLMMEIAPNGRAPAENIKAVCGALHYKFDKIPIRWKLILRPESESDRTLGLDFWYDCSKKDENL